MSQITATNNGSDTDHRGQPVGIVQAFLEALGDLDIDRALGFVADDVVYHNKGLPPARGKDAFERQMRGFGRAATGFEARIHNVAVNGPIVLTERTDVIEMGRFRAEFWVCGTFEVRDGRIVLWRDYFDFVNVTWSIVRALGAGLLRRSPRR